MALLDQQIEQVADLVMKAKNIVAITGAGISTPSGIPDFRSPDSGLWDNVDPLGVASIFAFRQSPQQFYNWIRPHSRRFLEAEPNPAHHALVALEREGKLRAIITQNIDDLHHKAGSQTVYELHGSLRAVTCIRCYETIDSAGIFDKFVQDGEVPRHHCGGVLKPNVILFGEQLPVREFVSAQLAVKEADLMLVAGSSLEVAPASDLPELALENGARLIIINYQATYLDKQADVVIHANLAEVLPRIVDLAQVRDIG
jgi:NAD-dependent deacetylase